MMWIKLVIIGFEVLGVVLGLIGMILVKMSSDLQHAVYLLLFQDSFMLTLSSILRLIFDGMVTIEDSEYWAQTYMFTASLPLAFHDITWSLVAYLRYWKMVKPDTWNTSNKAQVRRCVSLLVWIGLVIHLLLGGVSRKIIAEAMGTPNVPSWNIGYQTLFLICVYLTPIVADCLTLGFYFRIVRHKAQVDIKDEIEANTTAEIWGGALGCVEDPIRPPMGPIEDPELRTSFQAMKTTIVFAIFRSMFPFLYPIVHVLRGNSSCLVFVITWVRCLSKNLGIFLITVLHFGAIQALLVHLSDAFQN